jgi:hypothetical protein
VEFLGKKLTVGGIFRQKFDWKETFLDKSRLEMNNLKQNFGRSRKILDKLWLKVKFLEQNLTENEKLCKQQKNHICSKHSVSRPTEKHTNTLLYQK